MRLKKLKQLEVRTWFN
uniref:Uncharacterized protein n=1 Tax=Rhizophora mucronata TaxID=61149 RepID=A0A2P2QMK9_RHIMU